MKNVLITGASRGIGKATALLFAKNGYNVGIHYNKSHEQAAGVLNCVRRNGVDADCFSYDLSSYDNCKMLANDFLQRFGKIDVLINNAGISKIADISATDVSDWQETLNVNLSAPFYLTKELLPAFIKSKSGAIINISSVWGINGASCEVAYSASKAGLIGFTKALAKEMAPSGITVNAIAPGFIETDMNSELTVNEKRTVINEIPLCRAGKADDIAAAALFLASDSAAYITGKCLGVDGGWF